MANHSHVISNTHDFRKTRAAPWLERIGKLTRSDESAGASTLVGITIGLVLVSLAWALEIPDRDPRVMLDGFLSLSTGQKLAWFALFVSSLGLIAGTVWQSCKLARQGKSILESTKRMQRLRSDVDGLAAAQDQADRATQHLLLNTPADEINRLEQQLWDCDQRTLSQAVHYSAADLESRIADIRQRQEPLRDRVAALVEKRQALDAVFMDLNHRQYLIERALTDTEKKAHADEVEVRLQRLIEFIKSSQLRFDEIDRLASALDVLKGDFGEVELRLTPLRANRGLLENLTNELDGIRDRVLAEIDRLERSGDRSLAEKVKDFATAKQDLDERASRLMTDFGNLDTTRTQIVELLRKLDGSLRRNFLTAGRAS
jgi:hypothetical protein